MMATDLDDVVEADINNLGAYKDLWWGNYQIGIADVMKKKGYEICGCDMLFDDTTPHGGGLSSSAAIEVATALAFATVSNEIKGISEPVDMIEMAKISQQAEHEYIGVMCGIMDQFASAMGKKNHAIMLNCKTLEYDLVPVRSRTTNLGQHIARRWILCVTSRAIFSTTRVAVRSVPKCWTLDVRCRTTTANTLVRLSSLHSWRISTTSSPIS